MYFAPGDAISTFVKTTFLRVVTVDLWEQVFWTISKKLYVKIYIQDIDTKILEVNLFAFAYRLFHRAFRELSLWNSL